MPQGLTLHAHGMLFIAIMVVKIKLSLRRSMHGIGTIMTLYNYTCCSLVWYTENNSKIVHLDCQGTDLQWRKKMFWSSYGG
jgi:hypothetical protein